MADTKCKIFIREHSDLYFGVVQYGTTVACKTVQKGDSNGTDWIIRDIPQSNAKLLVKSGGLGDGWVLSWHQSGVGLDVEALDHRRDPEQVVIFDPLDGGYVAINNHDRTHVADRGSGGDYIIAFPWNGGWNQQWFIEPQ